jgi:4-amino-4-deoxy-L-arabinose transferase-like glycosyltransferase
MREAAVNLPRWAVWLGLLLIFFGGIAPTLSWLEFSGGLENLNIDTALELRRDHPSILPVAGNAEASWMIPTLEGEPRIKKPPLTAWITALAIRPQTVKAMSDADPSIRRAADQTLAWEVRWPSLLAACLMLIATYELGRVVADATTGIVAALIGGSTLMFLRFASSAMVDVHLGLWVTVANVFLAYAVLNDRRWMGCLGAGAALGLAFLTKGPVAWVQTLAPVIAFAVICPWTRAPCKETKSYREIAVRWIAPIALGLLIMCLIALPWYVYIYRTVPGAMKVWLHEASAERGERASPFYSYFLIFLYVLPWTISFIGGLINARRGMLLAVFLALFPLLVMSFYKDRKERYMYPMTSAAAVVAAVGIMALARKRESWNGLDRAAVVQHWALMVVLGVVVPAVAATTWTSWLITITGEPWLTRAQGAGLTIALGLIIAGGMLIRRHWLAALIGTTVIVTLTIHAALLPGYAKTEQGESPMRPLAERIWATFPDAVMLNAHPREKRASVDLSIYLNRVTEWVSMDSLEQMQPGPRPKVVVMLQDAKDKKEPTPPRGWKFVDKVPRDKDIWWAFVLEAK